MLIRSWSPGFILAAAAATASPALAAGPTISGSIQIYLPNTHTNKVISTFTVGSNLPFVVAVNP